VQEFCQYADYKANDDGSKPTHIAYLLMCVVVNVCVKMQYTVLFYPAVSSLHFIALLHMGRASSGIVSQYWIILKGRLKSVSDDLWIYWVKF